MSGPLSGMRILEFGGIGPGPFAGMMLADMGAEVILVDSPRVKDDPHASRRFDAVNRGRASIVLDLKNPESVEICLKLIETCDAVFEGFRPGVVERLGVGPQDCLARNPRLVYGRMTGWGQTGPMSPQSGHDLNYIALSGALSAISPPGQRPRPPLNILGDYAGGGMVLAYGIVCALLEASRSGKGQVIDAAMADGAALLLAPLVGLHSEGKLPAMASHLSYWYYNVYETADGEHVTVGALEAKFRTELEQTLIQCADWTTGPDGFGDPVAAVADLFRSKPRQEWETIFAGRDACFAPVTRLDEVKDQPHLRARGTYRDVGGVVQPSPAPLYDRTPGEIRPVPAVGENTDEILSRLGCSSEDIAALRRSNAVA